MRERSFSKKIVAVLVENHAAEPEQSAVIAFGAETIFWNLVHFGVMCLIGLLMKGLWSIIVFHLFYQKLRAYAGGYHAKSGRACFVCSCIMAVTLLLFWDCLPSEFYTTVSIAFLSISCPIIFSLSPVENINKPLELIEKFIYKKRAIVLFKLEAVAIICFVLFNLEKIALVGATALLIAALMVVLGRLCK